MDYDLNQIEGIDALYDGGIEDPDIWQADLRAKIAAQRDALGLSARQKWGYAPGTGSMARAIHAGIKSVIGGLETMDLNKLTNDLRFEEGFLEACNAMCERLGIKTLDLLICMAFETGGTFNSHMIDKTAGAVGLIGFLDSSAATVGSTRTALAAMDQLEQLKYVEKWFEYWFKAKKVQSPTFADLYMTIIFPVAIGKPNDFILFGKGASSPLFAGKGYRQNNGLDINKDGTITKAETAAQAYRIGLENLQQFKTK